jgi:hypothetical protein
MQTIVYVKIKFHSLQKLAIVGGIVVARISWYVGLRG